MKNVLVGVTGSVAAVKSDDLATMLIAHGFNAQMVATKSGLYFLRNSNPHGQSHLSLYTDKEEWPSHYKKGDPVLHIELRKWASCLLIAPLDANTLAKLDHGICDNLLTSVYRAWDWTRPVIVAPAMNTYMWDNEPTQTQLQNLQKRGVIVIPPVEKKLACNDFGMGAMAPLEEIVRTVDSRLRWQFPLKACNGIPINHHPGAFGFARRKNHHTGVDLYCEDHQPVHACESGTVVHIAQFTGPEVGHTWWERTWGVMVEGASGVINYGEIEPLVNMGQVVKRGQIVGRVKRVLLPGGLRTDIPGHSESMLHLELYQHGTRDFADWHDATKNPTLLDPTPFLMNATDSMKTLTWGNEENKTVG